MTLTAELPLIWSAVALALVAILRALPRHARPWMNGLAFAVGISGALAPILAYPFIPADKGFGRALWEWSAIGGPTIQASYRLDGVGAIGASAVAAYVVAALFAATRGRGRPPLLPALLIAIGHTAIALAVTDDLIASIVLLGVLASFTTVAALLVTPPPAAARAAAYLAVGVQLFVLAALLISRFGSSSFQFAELRPTAISPGIILAASLGASLFAGLYPFIPWRYLRAPGPVSERETLRGLLTMPAGVGASLVLLRLLGVTRVDLTMLGMPTIDPTVRQFLAMSIVVAVVLVALRRRVIPGRSIAGGGVLLLITITYPSIHWSHIALAAALLTVLYAAAASLAFPDEWEVARHDVTLAALWVGLALGTSVAIAAALAILVADALLAVAESVWLPPHRAHLVLVAGAATLVTGLGALAFGTLDLPDPLANALALLTILAILGLHLTHLERRVQVADPPLALDAASAAAAFLVTALIGILLAPALVTAASVSLGRDLPDRIADAPLLYPALAGGAILLLAAARSLRPVLPELVPLGRRLGKVVSLADPVPAAGAGYNALEWTATHIAGVFSFLERRAGVGLATLLIAGLLIWSVR